MSLAPTEVTISTPSRRSPQQSKSLSGLAMIGSQDGVHAHRPAQMALVLARRVSRQTWAIASAPAIDPRLAA
jgi:hypothetical protein